MPFLVTPGDQAASAYATVEAINLYNQALGLQSANDDLESLRRAFEGLGSSLLFANRIDEAIVNYQQMLEVGEKNDDLPTQISADNKLAATVGLRMGQFKKAEAYLVQAEKLTNKADEKSGSAETALVHCQMCTAQADFESVIMHMSQLVEIGHDMGSRRYVAEGLGHVASSLLYLTRFEEAQVKAEESLALAREIGDRELEAILLTWTLPMLALRNGDFAAARTALADGLAIADKIGAIPPQIMGNLLVADVAQMQGDYGRALYHGNLALEYALPLEEMMPWFVVPALGSLGSIYLRISKQFKDQITKFHNHALKLLESPAASMTAGLPWADLGHCAIQMGDLVLAEESFLKGLNVPSMFMYLEKPSLLAGSSLLALAQGNLAEAISLANKALSLTQEKQMQHEYPLAYLTRGKVLVAQNELENALQAFTQAEGAALKTGMRPDIWLSQLEMAKILNQLGRNDEAQGYRVKARAMVDEIAALFGDELLREAYLASALEKIAM